MKKFLFGTFLGAILGGIGWCAAYTYVKADIERVNYSDYLDKDIKGFNDYANHKLDVIHEYLEKEKDKLAKASKEH